MEKATVVSVIKRKMGSYELSGVAQLVNEKA